MGTFLAKRLLGVLPVIFGVSIVIFLLVQLAPGDTATVLLGQQATEAAKEQLRHAIGLDQPLVVQYFRWLARTVTGDFGTSIATQIPVIDLVIPRFLNTVILTAASLLLAIVLGYGIGFFTAIKRDSLFDRIATSLTLMAGSAPPFWLGLVLVLVFSIDLGLFPVSGMENFAGDGGTLDLLHHLVLPAVTTALGPAAIIARIVRAGILDALGKPHVRVARSKGLRWGELMKRHVILNALPPIVTITGLQLGYLLGGALLTEVVFAWPGLGSLLYDSITARDLPVLQAATLLIALVFVLANIGVDAINAILDPRLREA